MSLPLLLILNLAILLALTFALWLRSLQLRDVSIIDPFWGTGFAVVAWLSWLARLPEGVRPTLLAVLTTVWGLRLSIYLLWRNWSSGEDSRYAEMRRNSESPFWWRSLWIVFWLQAAILWFVSLPLQVAIERDSAHPLSWLDGVGIGLWTIGIFFETVGDWQLARFKSKPENRSKVMDRGLWRYTRHPNYFGDFCVWWGLYLIAASGAAWWTVLSPIAMSALLMKYSGAGLLETTITDRRPEYREYQQRTSAFFPMPACIRSSQREASDIGSKPVD